MTVRYKFKPIIPVVGWREEAAYTVDLALSRTKPDNLSLTALMWMQVETLKRCMPTEMLDSQFLEAAQKAAEDMREIHVGPFPHAVREEIYRHHLSEIRARDSEVPVTLCTESLDMWRSLGDDLTTNPASYVCGCGAGATPNRTALDTSPWVDARAAVDWEGKPVYEQSGHEYHVIR